MPAPDWKKLYKSMFHDEKPHVVVVCAAIIVGSFVVFSLMCCAWAYPFVADVRSSISTFNPNDLEETKRWAKATRLRVDKVRAHGNENLVDAEIGKITEEIRKHIGKDVQWDFSPLAIDRSYVRFSSAFFDEHPSRPMMGILELELLMSNNRQPGDKETEWLRLEIGKHIDPVTASQLRREDSVRVSAKIESIQYRGGVASVVLSNIKAKKL